MKKITVLLGIITVMLAALTTFGQEGIVTYEVKINMHRNIPKEREEMKNMIPEYRTFNQKLTFNANESLYKIVQEDEDEDPFGGGGPGGRGGMRFRGAMAETYTNHEASKRLTVQEFMGKKYLIEDSVRISPWKLGTETKTVLNYTCKQATLTLEERGRTQNIVVWYTDQLRPFLGPETYNTLPGAVLAVDINEGERTITATKVEIKSVGKNDVKAPSNGTKITQEEFRKMMQEQMERRRANGGGNGGGNDFFIRN